ncbi:hypothetical protein MgSA37_00705 [Mucilaginibacter gotjawali]|nr:hypothetical protein MgSA37_00705 [Mucilaginibacter gotjawali]
METLVINVPDKKGPLVRQILKELGVTIKSESTDRMKPSDYAKLIDISKDDAQRMIKDIEQSRAEWERDINRLKYIN